MNAIPQGYIIVTSTLMVLVYEQS